MSSPRRSLVALALALSAVTGCREGEQIASSEIALADGGYALVRVEVPGAQEARVTVALEASPRDGAFYALLTEDDAPRHVGWFDMTPYAKDARSCADSPRREARCNPEGAGYVVAAAETSQPAVALAHDLGKCPGDSEDTCTFYLAVVGTGRLPTSPRATVTVTTRGPGLGEPARVTPL